MTIYQIPENLAVAVTFHFNPERLQYLLNSMASLHTLGRSVRAHIITNTHNSDEQEQIRRVLPSNLPFEIIAPTYLGHPFLLTWCHFEIFRNQLKKNPAISHFMYLEDDICVKKSNIIYWVRGRELLRKLGFIPSFVRYEQNASSPDLFSTDITKMSYAWSIPAAKLTDYYWFLSFREPYQGMYFLDRELAELHFFGESSNPDFGPWGIREKAAQGVTFSNIPKGYFSRNLVGYFPAQKRIDQDCLVHHLPNNYANDPSSRFGKKKISQLIFGANFFW
jgi:hypothetical protein